MRNISITDFILPKGLLFFFSFVVLVVVGLQTLIASSNDDHAVLRVDGSCIQRSVEDVSGTIIMKLDCGGTEHTTKDTSLIAHQLVAPGPIICTTYKSDRVACSQQKPKDQSSFFKRMH